MDTKPVISELAKDLVQNAKSLLKYRRPHWWVLWPRGGDFFKARNDLGAAIRKLSAYLEFCNQDKEIGDVAKWLLSDAEAIYHKYGGK
ncbi:MAG: hypothetical protein M0R80_08050 [Proteobacteria bacterium]|jgi:hypothetical protein|nr:hypothetical protein [Pseudomonadota bacterium]